jgi:DNA invertase Pin-like site-specific DNA recombinase
MSNSQKKTQKTAVIYIRTSKQLPYADEVYSIAGQRKTCQEYAKDKGYKILKEFHECGNASNPWERSTFREVLKFASGNNIDAVLVDNGATRISRKLSEFILIQNELRNSDTTLIATLGFRDSHIDVEAKAISDYKYSEQCVN